MATKIRDVQAAIMRESDAGTNPDKIFERISAKFPDLTVEEFAAAVASLEEEVELRASDAFTKAKAMKIAQRIIEKAEHGSGQSDMTFEEAATFLEERNDPEVGALLVEMNSLVGP